MELIKRQCFKIGGGRNAEVKEPIKICPTLLARMYKGYDTYGIPGVIEIYEEHTVSDEDKVRLQK